MNAYIQPPPAQQQRGMGCLGKGCLILSIFLVFLIIAGAIGLYFGLKTYSAVVHGVVWAESVHALAPQPSPVPQFQTNEANVQAAGQKWHTFASAARRNEPAHVELTAEDLNNLIEKNPKTRGKAFVSMQGNELRIQTSIPVGEYAGRSGYYFNGNIVIRSEGARSLDQPPLNSVTVNGQPLPTDLPSWKFKGRDVQGYLSRYRQQLNSFEIRDGKLILDRGSP